MDQNLAVEKIIKALDLSSSEINAIPVTDPNDIQIQMEAQGFLWWAKKRLSELSELSKSEETETDKE